MASWLDKASGLFQRSIAVNGESTRQPYQFTCECGVKVTGLRESRFQQFPCEACGRIVFVLPENVYPKSAPAKKQRSETPAGDARKSETASEPTGETDANEFAETPPPPTRRKKSSGIDVAGGVRPRRKEPVRTAVPPPPAGLELPRRRRWTPLRVIVIGIVALVLTTGLGLGWRWRIEQARVALPTALERGLAAFGERRFLDAARELGEAKAAVEILGKQDAEADFVRARWREARAARDLAPFMLGKWLEECLQSPPDVETPATGAARDRIQGTWLVLDVAVAYEGEPPTPVADVLLTVGETPIEVDLVLPAAVGRVAAEERPTRVIVGAQVARFQPPGAGNPVGRLEFVPDAAFLWTDYDTYRVLGFEASAEEEPALRSLFAAQRRWEEAGK